MQAAHAAELDVGPLDATLYAVRRGAGIASYYRQRLADVDPDDQPNIAQVWRDLERDAISDLARWAKMALDTGVVERQALIAERQGAVLAHAFEDAVAGEDLQAAQRARMLDRYVASLLRLEATDE